MIVVDASLIVAVLIDAGPTGRWASELTTQSLAAPQNMPVEASSVLRRGELSGRLDPTTAALAYQDLLDLPVTLYPFGLMAARVWELRSTVSSYAATYVALAESLGCALATCDAKLAAAPGPTCAFLTPR